MSWGAFSNAVSEVAPKLSPVGSEARQVLVDGDALGYFVACKEGATLASARDKLRNYLHDVAATCHVLPEQVIAFITAPASPKGGRYEVAVTKPYQGNRSGREKPDLFYQIQEMLVNGDLLSDIGVCRVITNKLEADDLFSMYTHGDHRNSVIVTQDKDMRMLPGWHLDWLLNQQVFVPYGTFELWFNEKLYGHSWFWHQMLHGDTADNIPGLPKALNAKGTALVNIGEVGAAKALAGCKNNADAFSVVSGLYKGYGKFAGVDAKALFLEQANLLWLRSVNKPTPYADVSEFEAASPLGGLAWRD